MAYPSVPWVNEWMRLVSGRDSPEEAVEDLARGLLGTYREMYPRRKSPPLAKDLAPLRRISIDNEREADASGSLQVLRTGFTVRLGAMKNKNHRNFSVAHEIGHTYFFDIDREPPRPLIPVGKLTSKPAERLCDRFATSLLLPADALVRLGGALGTEAASIRVIEDWANCLTVSPETLVRRIHELHLLDGTGTVLVLSKFWSRKEPPLITLIGARSVLPLIRFNRQEIVQAWIDSGTDAEMDVTLAGNYDETPLRSEVKTYGRGRGMYSIAISSVPDRVVKTPTLPSSRARVGG